MKLWIATDETGRITASTDVEEYAAGMTQFDLPDDFDFATQSDWRIVDGALVHDPLPVAEGPTEEEMAEAAERETQLRAASMLFVRSSARSLSDDDALSVSLLFADWAGDGHYAEGDVARYAGELWRCRQDHDAQATWTPDQAHSLWARIVPPDTVEEWRQPQPGIFDGYTLGQKVTHDGHTWESTYDGLNVWEPGATGTETLWKQVPATGDA